MENDNIQQTPAPVVQKNNLMNLSSEELDNEIKRLMESKKPITKRYNDQIREIEKKISYIRDIKKLNKKYKK